MPSFAKAVQRRNPLTRGLALAWCLAAPALVAPAATYYVDCRIGLDQNDGLSPLTAWRTIERANQAAYRPGDRVRLQRGCAWHGAGFKANGHGTADAPMVLEDYGSPALPLPLLDGVGPHEAAVLLQNVQHWIVRNLELTQHGQTPQNLDPNNEKGKDADQYSDEYMRAVVHILGLGAPNDSNCGEACAVRDIRLENLVVHDGSWNGIYASGGYYQLRTAQYGVVDHLVIQGVESFNHHKSGVEITCTYFQTRIYAASNVWVLDSRLHDNGGDGVMVGPVRNGLLQGNECSFNGRLRNARVGCWTWDSQDTVIQFNESHHNRTPLNDGKARDGAGFDLDLGTENGLLQYNWSHDNEGEGFLLLSWPIGFGYARGESHHAQMRYNISERDGKKLAGAITVFGGVDPLLIHNNTIYYEPARSAGSDMFNGEGGALTTSIFGKSGKPNAYIYNNVFLSDGRTSPGAANDILWTDGAGTFTFDNNLWWQAEGGLRFQWAGAAVTTWAGWQAKGFDPAGLNVDPALAGAFGSGPGAYRPRPAAPGIDHGRILPEALGDLGRQDAFGATVPQGAGYDIGAVEFRVLSPDPAAARWTAVQRRGDGAWQLRFTGSPGRGYLVESSPGPGAWAGAGAAAEIAPGIFEYIDPLSASARYYRVLTRGVPGQ